MFTYFSLFSLIASNPEETKPISPSLIKILRVDGVYSFVKGGSVCKCLKTNLIRKWNYLSLVCTRTSSVCYPYVCTHMSSVYHSYVLVCHPYVTPMYSYVIPVSLVCTRMYPYVIHMSLACTRMSSVCCSYVLVCHPYVACMYLYVIPMSIVCTRVSSVCHSYVVLTWTCSDNPGQNIWNKIPKSSNIGQEKEKFDIHFCVNSNCYCQSPVSWTETGQ